MKAREEGESRSLWIRSSNPLNGLRNPSKSSIYRDPKWQLRALGLGAFPFHSSLSRTEAFVGLTFMIQAAGGGGGGGIAAARSYMYLTWRWRFMGLSS